MADLVSNLIATAREYGDRPAVKSDDAVLTYRDLLDGAGQVAGLLRSLGAEPGDRIALVLPNVPAFPVLFYGSLLAGCVVLPLNPQLKHREIEHCLSDSQATLTFAWDRSSQAAMSASRASGAECILVGVDGLSAEQLVGVSASTEPVVPSGDDNAVILYSAGMTGKPMGAQLTHANLSSNAITSAAVMGCTPADVMMGCLPLFHVFGLTGGLNASVSAGACLTLIPRFHPAKALEVIARDKVTIFQGVPTMYAAMLRAQSRGDSFDLSTLRTCISGGSAMAVEIMAAFEDAFGCIVLEGYGLSETSPVATFNHADAARKPGSIGRPVAGMELKLVDDDGHDIPDGGEEVGEIVIRGEGVMKGYWKRPDETAMAIRDGWFHSGDLATRDADGYYFIVGRKKDMIIRGGYNVYPREVEDALNEHEAVADVAVIGIEHPDLGEEVGAVVVLQPDAQASVADLQSFAKERVAAYKYPRHVWIVDELPKDSSGKVLRREVTPPSESADVAS